MRNILLSLIFSILSLAGKAQADSADIYRRFPTLPAFNITKIADSAKFTKDDLVKKRATIFILFNPFCDHCKHGTDDLKASIELFKDVQIVMASPVEFSYLKKFYDDYKIADYPNIIMGRDPSNYLGTFFNVQSIPAIFVYDKKGHFVKRFGSANTFSQIAEALKP